MVLKRFNKISHTRGRKKGEKMFKMFRQRKAESEQTGIDVRLELKKNCDKEADEETGDQL